MVTVRAQNEIYAALSKKGDKMYACTPDVISMVDPKTGEIIIPLLGLLLILYVQRCAMLNVNINLLHENVYVLNT